MTKTRRCFAISVAGVAAILTAMLAWASDVAVTRYVDDATDRMPKHTFAPSYPRTARRDRVEGEVQVCYYVDKKGRPYSVAVRKSTHRVFERPALRAVKASRYIPLEPGEKTSGIKTCRTFSFELNPVVAENGERLN